MTNLLVGAVIVVGACLALWLHHRRRDRLADGTDDAAERRFLVEQYARRSIATTLIGLVGLAVMGIEASRVPLLDALILAGMFLLLATIPIFALLDLRATRRHFKRHDEGVRHATRGLIDELKRIEQAALERRRGERTGDGGSTATGEGDSQESSRPRQPSE